jgi:hypothetical protein
MEAQPNDAAATEPKSCPVPRLWRRLGFAAFMFFLIKGLLWLIIPALAAAGALSWF